MDAIYSPVRRVSFKVDDARVGQVTDYDKLTLEVETNGVVSPEDALAYSARILQDQLTLFINFDEIIEEPIGGAHRERPQAIMQTKLAIMKSLDGLMSLTSDDLIKHRREKFLKIGRNL